MGIIRPLKPGLFIFYCIRLLILTAAFAVLQPVGPAAFPWLVYTAPNALFPLMALFLWLNSSRYGAYLPLFLAGKCVCLFSLLGWSIISRRTAIIENFISGALIWSVPRFIEGILLCGDLLAIAAALIIIKNARTAITAGDAQPAIPADMEDE
jgi:hypothetical protein